MQFPIGAFCLNLQCHWNTFILKFGGYSSALLSGFRSIALSKEWDDTVGFSQFSRALHLSFSFVAVERRLQLFLKPINAGGEPLIPARSGSCLSGVAQSVPFGYISPQMMRCNTFTNSNIGHTSPQMMHCNNFTSNNTEHAAAVKVLLTK